MARLRKAALAAVALSALALTSTAVSAHAQTGSTSKGSKASSMSWGHYSGELTDFKSTAPDLFTGARATAVMIAVDGSSFFRLHVTGIDGSAVGKTYPVHLHEYGCDATDPAAAGGHYNNDKENGVSGWAATNKNEVWLNFKVNSEENARSTARVQFVPRAESRSIVIHGDEAPNPRLACLPFEIKSYGN